MRLWARTAALRAWVDKAQVAQDAYFVIRRDLFAEFVRILLRDGANGRVRIGRETYNQIRNYLTSRNDRLSDAAKLAFVKACDRLDELCDEESVAEEAEESGGEEVKEKPTSDKEK